MKQSWVSFQGETGEILYMKITRTVVPSIVTALNIFCGFLSLLYTSQGHVATAAWIIILAAVFDSLDGIMARMTHSSSQFGVELDSLADVVSFGAAPSFLIYFVLYSHTIEPWGILLAAMPVVLGAVRLARFNSQLVGFDKEYFNGLPIPMQAITVCAFILQFGETITGTNSLGGVALMALVVALSLLMVSHVKYDVMPKLSRLQVTSHPWKFIIIAFAFLVIVISKFVLNLDTLFQMLMLYILFGCLRGGYGWLKKVLLNDEKKSVTPEKLSRIDL